MSERTETDAASDITLRGVAPTELDANEFYHVIVPAGADRHLFDLEKYLPAPRRKSGEVYLHTQDSFAHFVKEHTIAEHTHVYAERHSFTIVAVFNDASADDPGWRDHRADLALAKTPEWRHWEDADGKLMSQVQFAEHIEEGLLEIQVPTAAEMLELAQTFHANTNVEFKSATTLAYGQRQFTYVENTTPSPGRRA